MRYATVREFQKQYSCKLLCRCLNVTEQGYYRWLKHHERMRRRERLGDLVQVLFADYKGRYGSPRIHRELKDLGINCARKTVERVMKERELRAKAARAFKITTNSSHQLKVFENILARRFAVETPNKVWVGDITAIRSGAGWLYLAVFIDLFSRRVVGWSLSVAQDSRLAVTAFEHAVARRKPPAGLLVHTDRGTQFASVEFQSSLQKAKAKSSMSRTGNCWDNAVAESFFHSFKVEAIHGERFDTTEELRSEVFEYIEDFYNKRRRHSFINNLSPDNFEKASL